MRAIVLAVRVRAGGASSFYDQKIAVVPRPRCAAPTPVCDDTRLECVECLTSAHCASPHPACDPSTRRCVVCTPDDARACATDPSGRACVVGDAGAPRCGCEGDGDCATGEVCAPMSNHCVPVPVPDAGPLPQGVGLRYRGGGCECAARPGAVRPAAWGLLALLALRRRHPRRRALSD